MVKVLFFNPLASTYWIGEVKKEKLSQKLVSMNGYRCGKVYAISGASNVSAAQHLIPANWNRMRGPITTTVCRDSEMFPFNIIP